MPAGQVLRRAPPASRHQSRMSRSRARSPAGSRVSAARASNWWSRVRRAMRMASAQVARAVSSRPSGALPQRGPQATARVRYRRGNRRRSRAQMRTAAPLPRTPARIASSPARRAHSAAGRRSPPTAAAAACRARSARWPGRNRRRAARLPGPPCRADGPVLAATTRTPGPHEPMRA